MSDNSEAVDDSKNTLMDDAHYSVKHEPADYDNTDVLHCVLKVRF